MTPTEEVFSRRGGVKLLLMEMEHLRGALDALKLPVLDKLSSGACSPNTQGASVQPLQGPESMELRVGDNMQTSCSPSPVGRAMPAAQQRSKTAASASTSWGLKSDVVESAQSEKILRPTHHMLDSTSTGAEKVGAGPEEAGSELEVARPSSLYLPRLSSGNAAVNGSGRRGRLGREKSTQASLQSMWTGADKGVWTNLRSHSQKVEQEPPATTAVSLRGRSRLTGKVNSQHLLDHQRLVAIQHCSVSQPSFSRMSGKLPQARVQLSTANGM